MSNSTPYVQYIPGCEQLLFFSSFFFLLFICSASTCKVFSPRSSYIHWGGLLQFCWPDVVWMWPASRDEKEEDTPNVSQFARFADFRNETNKPKKNQVDACKRTRVEGMAGYWDSPELVGFRARFTSLSRHCTLCFGWLVSVMVWVVAGYASKRGSTTNRGC